MFQLINVRSSITTNCDLMKNNKKKLFLYFFFLYKQPKKKNSNSLNNYFYQQQALLLNLIKKKYIKNMQISSTVLKKNLLTILKLFKFNFIFKYNFLTDVAVYDNPGKTNRFTLVILLQSLNYNTRTEIIIKTNETTPVISLYGLFKSAS
jgi:NADH:ubiquinone oxidoreductase subunit C